MTKTGKLLRLSTTTVRHYLVTGLCKGMEQFAECQSADFESLLLASLPTELTISTQSLTPLSTSR